MAEDSAHSVCPVCDESFPISKIEVHVDSCLKEQSQKHLPSVKRKEESSPAANKKFKGQTAWGCLGMSRVKSDTKNIRSSSSLQSSPIHRASKSKSNEGQLDLSSSNGKKTLPVLSLQLSTSQRKENSPLADQLRPSTLDDYVGQEESLGKTAMLRSLIENHNIPSMILWGPPGCGKTTLAHILSKRSKERNNTRFVTLSATMSGVTEVKNVVKVAKNDLAMFKRKTILFIDEIHRFNKLQQDSFLPHVENGTIILIGATTENPSFSLNSALLSRCRVVTLDKLGPKSLARILSRAVEKLGINLVENKEEATLEKRKCSSGHIYMESAALCWLSSSCDGDARSALNSLELTLQSQYSDQNEKLIYITKDMVKEGAKRSHVLYDRKGDEHYHHASALQKSIRASDDNAALYWVSRMLEGGEDPMFVARRLVRTASEDVGLGDPLAVSVAVSAMQACQLLGMPECDVILAQCAVYLARAQKSPEVYLALHRAQESIREHVGPLPGVPLHLRNASTKLMKDLGYGKGYSHNPADVPDMTYMPDGMEHINFFNKIS